MGMTGLALAMPSSGSQEKLEEIVENGEKVELKQEELTEANQWLRDFPEDISGAGEVEKHETPNAEYALAHIKQKHYVDDLRKVGRGLEEMRRLEESDHSGGMEGLREKLMQSLENDYSDFYNEIESSQRDIYEIVDDLNEKIDLEEIYLEGISQKESLEPYYQGLENIGKLARVLKKYKINEEMLKNRLSEEEFKELRDSYGEGLERLKEMDKRLMIEAGGGMISAYHNGMEIIPAEDKETYRLAVETKEDNLLYDQREKALLDIISNQDKPYGVTVYGRGHDFKKTIEEWNEENPDMKFSYIGIETSSGSEGYDEGD